MPNTVNVPNGDDLVMSNEVFNQDPKLFMNMLIGSIVIGRVNNNQADRLEDLFDRDFIKNIINKPNQDYTWDDYVNVLNCCL